MTKHPIPSLIKALGISAVLTLSWSSGATADDAALAQQFGLLGRWSQDCSGTPSLGDSTVAISTSGRLIETFIGHPNTFVANVSELKVLDNNRISIHYSYPRPGLSHRTVIELQNNKRRIIDQITSAGVQLAEKGQYMIGVPTSTLSRCEAASS